MPGRTPEYIAWKAMNYRVRGRNGSDYNYYGGRGIFIAPAWANFATFLADMGAQAIVKTYARPHRQRRPVLKRKLPVGYAGRAAIQHAEGEI